MAKLTITLDSRRANKDGMYPIKLQLTNNRTNTTISTGFCSTQAAFIGKIGLIVSKSLPMADRINSEVQRQYIDALTLLNELERKVNIEHASASTIKEHLERMANLSPMEEMSFTATIKQYIEQCRAKKTAQGYAYASDLLHSYMKKDDVFFEDITYSLLDSFDRWMERNKDMAINSRSIVFRNIRTVFNFAIKKDYISQNLYPFKKFEIKRAKKEKDFLTLKEMKDLVSLELKGELQQARDYFMLSFYLCGINPIDLYQLDKPNKKDIVTFIRQKIAHAEPAPIHICIPDEAKQIIERYSGDTHLLKFAEKHDYDTFIRRIKRNIKRIGDMIEKDLYMYMARYTWATFADHLGVPHEVISKALGHTDGTTAERYYISFNWDRVTKANRQVIDYLHSK